MLKTLAWLAVGLVGGAVLVSWLQPAIDRGIGTEASAATLGIIGDELDLERELASQNRRLALLEERIAELTTALEATGAEQAPHEDANVEMAARLAIIENKLASVFIPRTPVVVAGARFSSSTPSGNVRPLPGAAAGTPTASSGQVAVRNAALRAGAALRANAASPSTASASAGAQNAETASSSGPLEAPSNLTGVTAQPGQTLVFRVTGATDGSVWGTDVYTDDSSIATAAVHAGILRPDETGTVLVTILPGYASYASSTRFGVTSAGFAEWGRSFVLQRIN